MPHLLSVNVGQPREKVWAGIGRTSIDKRPVAGRVAVGRRGLDGDQVSDTRHHGGLDKAVYAFAREDLDHWGRELGRDLCDGAFGENLTTTGIDVNEAEVGERWLVGTVVLEVCSVRTPCRDFAGWLGENGYDNTRWVRRFTTAQRPGPYLRVLEEGTVAAGDELRVVHRPGHGVTVSTMFRAVTTERDLLPHLLVVDDLTEEARRSAEAAAAARSDTHSARLLPPRNRVI